MDVCKIKKLPTTSLNFKLVKLFHTTMGRKLDWLGPVPWHIRDLPDLVHRVCQKNTCKYSGVIASSWQPIWEQISFYLNIHTFLSSLKVIRSNNLPPPPVITLSLFSPTTTNTRRSKTDVNHGLYISPSRSVRHF